MRVVVLDCGVAERLDPREPAETLQRRLHEAGLFTALRGTSAEEVAISRLPLDVHRLGELERTIDRASHAFAWMRGSVPNSVYWGILAVFVVLSMIGTAIWGMGTLFAIVASPLVLAVPALAGLGYAANRELARREVLAGGLAARAQAGKELTERVTQLLATTWVGKGDNVQVVCAPHQTWLRARLAELRAARSPTEGPERAACVARLEAALARIEASLREPGEALVPDRVVADITTLSEEVARLGLPVRSPPSDGVLAARLQRR